MMSPKYHNTVPLSTGSGVTRHTAPLGAKKYKTVNFYTCSINDILMQGLTSSKQHKAELTDRETEFLKLACTELPYKSFSPFLKVSPRVVESIRETLFKKLVVVSRVGLVIYAIRHGIFKVE